MSAGGGAMFPIARRGITRRDALRLGLGIPIAWAGACATASRGDDVAEKPSKRIYFYGELIVGTERLKGTFAVDPDAGTWVRITTEGNPLARVSPDGRRLAFVKGAGSAEKERGIWTCSTRGDDEPNRITDLIGRPSWSRDGKRLVISGTGKDDQNSHFQTWMVQADGSEPMRLPIPETDIVLDWTPDDAWFLVSANRKAGLDFVNRPAYVIRPDGTDEHRITESSDLVRWRHRFASGGKKVTYFQLDKNDDCRLWIVDLDGRNRRVFLGEHDDRAPFGSVSSPDGNHEAILYFDRTPGDDGKRNDVIRGCTIEVVDADGTNARPLSLPEAGTLSLLDWC
jgi:dipeptidyl aminopeptidase/acylaminoacyl peptidase